MVSFGYPRCTGGSGGWEFAVPQEASVCLYQAGSESDGLPPDDSASLYTAEHVYCTYCKKPAGDPDRGDGVELYVDLGGKPMMGFIHDMCLELWVLGLGLQPDEDAA